MPDNSKASLLATLRMFANWRMIGLAFAIAGCALIVLIYPDLIGDFIQYRQERRSAYMPPRYQGSWMAYSLALFSMFSIVTLSVRKLWQMVLEYRAGLWPTDIDISLYRYAFGSVLVTFIVGIAPDVIELLAYGEVRLSTMAVLQTLDRTGDGCVLPFALFALFLVARAEQLHRIEDEERVKTRELLDAIEARGSLADSEKPPRRAALFSFSPNGEVIAEYWNIVAIVLVIAVGLATLK
jgi:hypothetical protein